VPDIIHYYFQFNCFMYNVIMNIEEIRQYAPQIRLIALKYGITEVFIFGSAARCEDSPGSDVDFMVEMKPGASLFGTAGFSYDTSKLLGISVDVIPTSVLSHASDREFAASIQKDVVAL